MALKWKGLSVGPFGMNAYVLWCDETKAAILIDPGDEVERLTDFITEEALRPERIVITHAHIDHVLYSSAAQQALQLPLHMHRDDVPLLQNLERQAESVGLLIPDVQPPRVDSYLQDGEILTFGKQQMKVVHAPGHSPGSIMLIGSGVAVVGDVLFQGSIGRTDLPGGSYEVLMRTIFDKLMTLQDSVRVLPGHGEETTIGLERLNNPFLQPGTSALI